MTDDRWIPPVGPVDPDHPECAAVIAEVWTLLDGECTAETRDKLKHHLEECPTCLRYYGVEERVKRLIAAKCITWRWTTTRTLRFPSYRTGSPFLRRRSKSNIS